MTVNEIKKLTQNYTVLYVEDEETARVNMVPLLEIFFKKVYVSENGQRGLELFNTNPVDIVITDIQMPNMNGLEMVANIRKKSHDIPVIITTAFGNQEYFIASINLRVDQYLLKPIEEENAKNVFHKVAQMLDDRKKARAHEQQKIQEKINQTSEQIISTIANAYPNPCIIYSGGSIRFINAAFASLFEATKLVTFLDNNETLNGLFESRDGYLSSITDYNPDDPVQNKVSISRNKGRKIFRIIRRELMIDEHYSKSIMYTFNDITWEEYQKVKIKSYTELLEEFIIRNRYSFAKPATHVPTVEVKVPQSVIAKTPESESKYESTAPKRHIGDMEESVLRRSHTNKTTAQDYVKELDFETLQELQELHELDTELESSLSELISDGDFALFETISAALEVYASKINLLFQFDDLTYAIRSLASLLLTIDHAKIDPKVFKKLTILLSGIQEDLVSWRNNIFIEQNALDIHYLDSSLFSCCLQIELALSDEVKQVETSDEDFELF